MDKEVDEKGEIKELESGGSKLGKEKNHQGRRV